MNDKKMKVVFKKQKCLKGLSWFVEVILFLVITSLLILLFKSHGLGQIGCILGQEGYWKDESTYYFCNREEMGIGTDSNATITEGLHKQIEQFEQFEHLKMMPNLEGDPCAKDPTMYGYIAPGNGFVLCPEETRNPCFGREGKFVLYSVDGPGFYCRKPEETTCSQAGITVYCPRGAYFQCLSPGETIKCY